MIDFNKPYLTGKEAHYIYEAVYKENKISGNGKFTQLCHKFFQDRYSFNKCLLTTSCTDALEMAAILFDIKPDDEVIIPSFTFVSTANSFVLRGAILKFADSNPENPNIDVTNIEELITPKTKAIVPVHYAGIACDMDVLMSLANKYNLYIVEDAAQAIDSYYKNRPLGSIGHLAAFSFHETKNIISGEGGMLAVNDESFIKRAEIIWEKGTNRVAFFNGEVDKYNWVDVGSSFLPSEIIAAFLYAQLENLHQIQNQRKKIWEAYYENLKPIERRGDIRMPYLPEYATNNASMFFIVCHDMVERDTLIEKLKENNILAVFHYQPLHKSPYYQTKHDGRELKYADYYSNCLLRLPFYYELQLSEIELISNIIKKFYQN